MRDRPLGELRRIQAALDIKQLLIHSTASWGHHTRLAGEQALPSGPEAPAPRPHQDGSGQQTLRSSPDRCPQLGRQDDTSQGGEQTQPRPKTRPQAAAAPGKSVQAFSRQAARPQEALQSDHLRLSPGTRFPQADTTQLTVVLWQPSNNPLVPSSLTLFP